MTLGRRLAIGSVVLVVTVSATSFIAADAWMRPTLQSHLESLLENEARLAAETIAADTAAPFNAVAHRLGSLIGRRVTIIDSAGIVVGDSDFDDASLALLDNHLTRPEIVAVAGSGSGVAFRHSDSTNRTELKVAVAAWPGFVRISAPLDQVETVIADARRAVLLAGFLALAVALLLAVVGERTLRTPLKQLTVAARAVAHREAVTYPDSNVREIRDLVGAFRLMDEELETHIREAEVSRSETESVLQSLAQGVVAIGSDGEIRWANEAARSLLPVESSENVRDIRDLLRSEDERRLVDRVLAGDDLSGVEFSHGERTLIATARPLGDGGSVLGFLDISDLKRINSIRRDFVANVSHELKTPLTSILGYSETLLKRDVDDETRHRFLSTIHDNSRRMQRMVDELLDLARIESGSWQPSPSGVSVSDVARSCWALLEPRARDGVTFGVNVNPDADIVRADPDAFTQIVTNLLDNALRFTEKGSIGVETARTEAGLIVRVSDTGAGIAGAHIPRLFERFYRVDAARSRAEGGTGLGLSIVKHLTEAHGGTVAVTSTLGAGTTFELTFPTP